MYFITLNPCQHYSDHAAMPKTSLDSNSDDSDLRGLHCNVAIGNCTSWLPGVTVKCQKNR